MVKCALKTRAWYIKTCFNAPLKLAKNIKWETIWSSRNGKCFPRPLRNMQQNIKEKSYSKLIQQNDNALTRGLRNM